jgi:RHS repeat-associated protein
MAAADNNSDSVHLGVNGQPLTYGGWGVVTPVHNRQWWWVDDPSGAPPYTKYTVTTPGVYTLNLWMREDATWVDRIQITLNPSTATTGNNLGPAADTLQGGTSGGGGAPGATTRIASFTYDAAGREATRTHGQAGQPGAGLVTSSTYGRADHLITAATVTTSGGASGGGGSLDHAYAYDALKSLTSHTRGGVMAPYSFSTNHDAEQRVNDWDRSTGESQDWTLSPVGDWDTFSGTAQSGVGGVLTPFAQARTHNDVHEIEIITPTLPGGAPQLTITHDPEGNVTTDDFGRTYAWDYDNRLASTIANGAPGDDAQYSYDALGRRVAKEVTDPQTQVTETTTFSYAGWQVLAEHQNQVLARHFVYGRYIDEPLAMDDQLGVLGGQPGFYWYHHDRQYNVTALTDDTGTVVEHAAYSPYGETLILNPAATQLRQISAVGNPYAYTGRRLDAETGQYYFRYRMYSPTLGRFLSRDPLGYVDGMSLYAGYFGVWQTDDPLGLTRSGPQIDRREHERMMEPALERIRRVLQEDGGLRFRMFNSELKAIYTRYRQATPQTARDFAERCGMVCRTENCEFYTTYQIGFRGWCIPVSAPCRRGDEPVAGWHTHNMSGPDFSPDDRDWVRSSGLPLWMHLPDPNGPHLEPSYPPIVIPPRPGIPHKPPPYPPKLNPI